MSTEPKLGESKIAAAMREMLDGFREAGVLPHTAAPQPTALAGPTPE
jgi:hypothetical protein